HGVSVEQTLGVRVRAETPAARFEAAAQLAVVVNLAVERDREAAVVGGDRLMAVLDVDDAETAHAERDGAVDELSAVVGTAMPHRLAHAAQEPRIEAAGRLAIEPSDDAAHVV